MAPLAVLFKQNKNQYPLQTTLEPELGFLYIIFCFGFCVYRQDQRTLKLKQNVPTPYSCVSDVLTSDTSCCCILNDGYCLQRISELN